MYRVEFTQTAAEDLGRLNKPIAQRILAKIRWVADNFQTLIHQPLSGQWQGVYKLRVGDYRVLYTFDENNAIIIIHFIRHRREVYRTR